MFKLEGPSWGFSTRAMTNDGLSIERGARYPQGHIQDGYPFVPVN